MKVTVGMNIIEYRPDDIIYGSVDVGHMPPARIKELLSDQIKMLKELFGVEKVGLVPRKGSWDAETPTLNIDFYRKS